MNIQKPAKTNQFISKILTTVLFVVYTQVGFSQKDRISVHVIPQPIDAVEYGNILKGPAVLSDPNNFIWCASVIKGKDHKYHMFYSTWEAGDSLPAFANSWVLCSKIAYAVSNYPDRDYKFQKIILTGTRYQGNPTAWDAQMVHNPQIKYFNGKYYLYYIGSHDPGPQPAGSKGEKLSQRNRVQQSQCIGVVEFDNFKELMKGNIRRSDVPLLQPRSRVKPDNVVNPSPEGSNTYPDNLIVVNPSVVQRPSDGKYLLYFKGNIYTPEWRGVHGVAISDSPSGPFKALDEYVFDIKDKNGKIASCEDPFVWYHPKNKKFYVVLKDFTGSVTEGQPGLAILESLDGIHWEKMENSFFMKKEIVLKNGHVIHVNRLERPQLLIDKNGTPTTLFAACSIVNPDSRKDAVTFNVHIPLKIAKN